jgi:hypothetical protein
MLWEIKNILTVVKNLFREMVQPLRRLTGTKEGLVLKKTWRFFLMLAITLSLSFAAGALLKKTFYLVQPVIDRL